VKPERVALRGVLDPDDAIRRVFLARLSEARALEAALNSRDKRALHGFRIACKRLRYARDRIESPVPGAAAAADLLARLQDALGEAHDRDVLLAILPPTMGRTHRRLQDEREAYVDRARSLWESARDLA